jgi:ComEC/Rec2-related protein
MLIQYLADYILSLFLILIFLKSIEIMQQPTPLLFFLAGIFMQKASPIPILILLLTTAVVGTMFFLFKKKSVCFILLLLTGATALALQKKQHTLLQKKLPTKMVSLEATILDKKTFVNRCYKEAVTMQTKKFGKIVVYIKEKTDICPGEKIKLKNITFRKVRNFTKSDFYDYLLKENITTTLFLKKINFEKIKFFQKTIREYFIQKKEALYLKLKEKIPEKTFAYFSSIFLGNKSETIAGGTASKSKHAFYYWGTGHLLARSGLHIALFILLVSSIFSYIPIPYTLKHLFIIFLCGIYALLSWTSVSFIRALIIFFLYQLGRIFNRQTNILYMLQIAAYAILIQNPIKLFFLDFQLSFTITFAIAAAFYKSTTLCHKESSPFQQSAKKAHF